VSRSQRNNRSLLGDPGRHLASAHVAAARPPRLEAKAVAARLPVLLVDDVLIQRHCRLLAPVLLLLVLILVLLIPGSTGAP